MILEESTVTFGHTMYINDLDGGAVTPPPCAASVPLPVDLSKAIEEELKASSGILADPFENNNDQPSRPTVCKDAHGTRWRSYHQRITTLSLYSRSYLTRRECARYRKPRPLRWQLLLWCRSGTN